MTEEDFRALPLIHAHVNPYGRFELDMEQRLDLEMARRVTRAAATLPDSRQKVRCVTSTFLRPKPRPIRDP